MLKHESELLRGGGEMMEIKRVFTRDTGGREMFVSDDKLIKGKGRQRKDSQATVEPGARVIIVVLRPSYDLCKETRHCYLDNVRVPVNKCVYTAHNFVY